VRFAAVLVIHSLRRVRGLLLGLGLLLAGFQVLATLLAGTFQESNTFGQIAALAPPFVRQLVGPSMFAVLSFQGMVCLGYFHPIVIGALVSVVMAVATEPAAEIERRFADLILARPVARHVLVTRSIVVLIVSIAIVVGLMVFGTWLGLASFAPEGAVWPSRRLVGSLAISLGALALCWSGVTLAIATRARRRGVAGSIAGLLAFGAFLFDYIARAWAPARRIGWLTPFHYYNPTDLLLGRALDWTGLWTLAGLGLAGFVLAYVFFSRRDV
jgi:ABC-2 type transport system permease protein